MYRALSSDWGVLGRNTRSAFRRTPSRSISTNNWREERREVRGVDVSSGCASTANELVADEYWPLDDERMLV